MNPCRSWSGSGLRMRCQDERIGQNYSSRSGFFMPIKTRLRPYRLLMVTYDLTQTVSGDRRYKDADSSLEIHGMVFRPVKQLRLIITQSTSKAIKASLEQRIGRQSTIFIAPISSIPAWHISGIAKRREWRRFVQALTDNNIDVRYVSQDTDSATR